MIAFGFGLFGQTATAGWQFTHWGMTPDEVVSASNGRAGPPTSKERLAQSTRTSEALLKVPWTFGNFDFTAYFYFGSPRTGLSKVHLVLSDATRSDGLASALKDKYGAPVENRPSGGTARTMRWNTDVDRVSFLLIPGKYATLTYTSRVDRFTCSTGSEPSRLEWKFCAIKALKLCEKRKGSIVSQRWENETAPHSGPRYTYGLLVRCD